MKKIFLIFTIPFLLTACDPPIECASTCDGKRIRNIENSGEYFTIDYDSENQPVRYEKALSEFATFDYQSSQVTKVYDGAITIYTLDAFEKVVASSTPSLNTSYFYKYDINDQVIETIETKNGAKTTFFHKWVKGNLVETKYDRPLGNLSTTVTYEYDPDTRNTVQNPYLEMNLLGSTVNNNIQSEYLGLNLTGETSGNAIKKITKSFVNRTGLAAPASIITTYDYVKDGCGCITSSTETVGTNIFKRDYLYEIVE